MANRYQESLYSILGNGKQVDATLTIEGEILSLEDAGLGKYKVKYMGNIITVYAQSPDMIFHKGDIVCILVPNGDLANENKVILRSTAQTAAPYTSIEDKTNYYIYDDELLSTDSNVDLCTYHNEIITINASTDGFHDILQGYLNQGVRTFRFSTKVRTDIEDVRQRVGGNYGVSISLPVVENGVPTTRNYTLDINNMLGDVYDFESWTNQELYFMLPEDIELDYSNNASLTFFVKDFVQSGDPNIPYDIHFKEFSLHAASEVPLEARNGYYLRLSATEGEFFREGSRQDVKYIIPTFYANQKETSYEGNEVYWFIEDASVKVGNEDYNIKGGAGWRCLNKKINVTTNDDGTSSFDYDTSNYKLQVKKEDIYTSAQYKCVLCYGGQQISNTITIKNLDSPVKIELTTSTGFTEYVQGIGDINLICKVQFNQRTPKKTGAVLEYEWTLSSSRVVQISDSFYELVRLNDSADNKFNFETEIKFPTSYIDKQNMVTCTVYSKELDAQGISRRTLIGNEKLILTTATGADYVVSISNNDVIYKYDSDGDSPMVSDYDGPAAKIKDIAPFNFRAFKLDGREFTDVEYRFCKTKWSLPKRSMMVFTDEVLENVTSEDLDYYYIEGNGRLDINYTIKRMFDSAMSNNTVLLEINFDGVVTRHTCVASFIKDGMSGTNGTKFSAVIRYEDYPYGVKDANGEVRKLRLAYAEDTEKWYVYKHDAIEQDDKYVEFADAPFTVYVYRDGEPATDYESPVWEMFDEKTTNPFFTIGKTTGILTATKKWVDKTEGSTNIVRATLRVGNSATSITGNGEDLYIYYPIEITRVEKEEYLRTTAPMIEGGFDSVLYATDGTNPKYDNNYPFHCIDSLYNEDAYDYYDYKWSVTENLKIKSPSDTDECSISPVTVYDNGVTNNYVKVQLTSGNGQILAIQSDIKKAKAEYYNHYYAYCNAVKNFELINNLGVYYRYKLWMDILEKEEVKERLTTKVTTKTTLDFAKEALIKLRDYVQEDIHKEVLDVVDFETIVNDNLTSLDNTCELLFAKIRAEIALPTLVKIQLTAEQIAELKENFDDGVYECIDIYLQDYNDNIDKYNILKENTMYSEDLYNVVLDYGLSFLGAFETFKITPDQLIEVTEMPAPSAAYKDYIYKYVGDIVDGQYYPGFAYECKLVEEEGSVWYWKVTYYDDRLYDIYGQLLFWYDAFFEHNYNYLSLDGLRTIFNEINLLVDPVFFTSKDTEAVVSSVYLNEMKSKSEAEKVAADAAKTIWDSYERVLEIAKAAAAIIHIKPILLSYNRYEMANINGWDGNKLYTGDNDEYLLAPQVGAGKKEKDNSFTGMVMGIRKNNAGTKNTDVGLFGYHKGEQTVFLDAMTGKSTFGTSGKGQIVLDPTQDACIYSGNYEEGKSGMVINLTKPEIKWANGGFWVDPDGVLHAGGSGEDEAGDVAGWRIGKYELKSENGKTSINSRGYGYRSTDADAMLATWFDGVNDKNTNHGTIVSEDSSTGLVQIDPDTNEPYHTTETWANAWIPGVEGKKEHWGYDRNKPKYSPRGRVYFGPDGISVSDMFRVDTTGTCEIGRLSGSHWTIESDPDIDITYISYNTKELLQQSKKEKEVLNNETQEKEKEYYWEVNNSARSVYLGTNGISLGQKFKVSVDGSVEMGHLAQEHWRINSNKGSSFIYNGDVNEIGVDNLSVKYLRLNRNGREKDVYLGTDGIVIGNMMSITTTEGANNKITLGDMSIKDKAGHRNKYWCIGSKNGNTYFAYDTSGDFGYNMGAIPFTLEPNQYTGTESIYIGTDGIRIGTIFKAMSRGDGRNNSQISIGAIRERSSSGERCFKVGTTNTGAGVESWFYSNRGRSFAGKDTMVTQFCAWIPNSPNRHDMLIGTDGIRIGQKFCYVCTGNDYQGYIMDDVLVGHRELDGTITWAPLSEYGGGGGATLPRAENYYF